jgi:PPOX class probable F420-dependent enzyme
MLDTAVRELAQGANLAALSFHLPSGRIATHIMWVDADDEHLIFNTELHRAKFQAIERDPNVTITIMHREDPHRYTEVRGRVVATERGPVAREHIDALSQQYRGRPYHHEVESERVIVRVAADYHRST